MNDNTVPNGNNEFDIAIIGMDGRYPGAASLEEFWRNLCEEKDVLEKFDLESLEEPTDSHIRHSANFVHAGYPLVNAEGFDAAFFDMSPKEATVTDPQQRLFLECCWQAMENAGYIPGEGNTRVGVFASANFNSYWAKQAPALRLTIPARYMETVIGNDKDYMATRVAWKLGLTGPALAVQSACSSSLVGISLAMQSLQLRQCDMALAGAAALRIPQRVGYLALEEGGMSLDARCHSFGAGASGMIDGHGVGVVLLKRLGDALRDNDNILAVICGAAVNNDGKRKVSFSAPSVDGQRDVITEALENAALTVSEIDYVEAHGTGTPLGDPIEVAALNQVWQGIEHKICWLGSVKSNIGHLDSASGVTAVIKTTLALMNEQLPASLNSEPTNPAIDFTHSPFRVNTRLRPWPRGIRPRRAGISSFGLGGTNAHLILQEAPLRSSTAESENDLLLVLSARSESALRERCYQLADYLRRHPQIPLVDVVFTLQTGRKAFEWRCAKVCSSREDAINWLEKKDHKFIPPHAKTSISFVLPGMGQQHAGMGIALYQQEPAYRLAVDSCCNHLEPLLGQDLRDYLYPPASLSEQRQHQMDQSMTLSMSALFVTEYAMTQLWKTYGVIPDAMIGHSLGQYLAAHLAGIFSLETALELVVRRAELIEKTPTGAMLAVRAEEEKLRTLLPSSVSLGAINAPGLCMVSGLVGDIESFSRLLRAEQIPAIPLTATRAGHSHLLDSVLPEFRNILNDYEFNPPLLPLICNLSGDWLSEQNAVDPEYWVRHLRETVKFAQGFDKLATEAGNGLVIDMGPDGGLSSLLRQQRVRFDLDLQVNSFANSQIDAHAHWLSVLAKVWTLGYSIDWSSMAQKEGGQRVPLPGYPFEHQRYMQECEDTVPSGQKLLAEQQSISAWLPGWVRTLPPCRRKPESGNVIWLCAEPGSLCSSLHLSLEKSGMQVIELSVGKYENSIQIDALDGDSWQKLWQVLPEPAYILLLWPLDEKLPASFSFDTLLAMSQGIQGVEQTDPLHLVLASMGLCNISGNEVCWVEHASLLGAAAVLSKENPGINCQVVDISGNDMLQQQTDNLLASLLTDECPSDGLCAWRAGQYWRRELTSLPWPDADIGRERLQDNGRYLIFGGTGGIGHTLAMGIARNSKTPHLVLVGRQELCAKREKLCATLIEMGATVSYLKLDLNDADTVIAKLAGLIKLEGRFNGVIHAAGSVSGGLMQLSDRHAQKNNMCCKAHFILVLEPLLRQFLPDFVLLCSSLSSFSSSPGQVDNTAANFILDSYAVSRRLPCPVLTVNWDYWLDTGMIQTLAEQHYVLTGREITEGIRVADAMEYFLSLLALMPLGQVAVAGRDLSTLLHMSDKDDIRHFEQGIVNNSVHHRAKLFGHVAEPENDLQWVLTVLWGESLGIDKVGIHDDYNELGGDSLTAIGLAARIRETLRINFSIRTLFEYPNIMELEGYLQREYSECVQIATLVRQVSALDEKQLAEWLATLDGGSSC